MRQVIVRLRDCRPTYTKTIKTCYYYSQAQYKSEVFNDFENLMPGQEIYVKIGNRYCIWITYEEAESASNSGDYDSVEDYIYNKLVRDYSLNYHVENYLPRY